MEVLNSYKEELLYILVTLSRSIYIFIIALSIVYLFGRMLDILHSNTFRNFTAFIVIVSCNIFYTFKVQPATFNTFYQSIWEIMIFSAVSILLYVLIGFKLYDRVDCFFDKKIGKDKGKK